jgi:hypothetical protein
MIAITIGIITSARGMTAESTTSIAGDAAGSPTHLAWAIT